MVVVPGHAMCDAKTVWRPESVRLELKLLIRVGQRELVRGWTFNKWAGGQDGADGKGAWEEVFLEQVRKRTSALLLAGNSIEVGVQTGDFLW